MVVNYGGGGKTGRRGMEEVMQGATSRLAHLMGDKVTGRIPCWVGSSGNTHRYDLTH